MVSLLVVGSSGEVYVVCVCIIKFSVGLWYMYIRVVLDSGFFRVESF